MATTSQIVKKLVTGRPLLYEALVRNIVNYGNVAKQIKAEVEAEAGKEVKEPAIVMSLRRLAEQVQSIEEPQKHFKFTSDIIMKTGLVDITITKSASLIELLTKIYNLVDFEKGHTLNLTQGNYELTIVLNEKYLNDLLKLVKKEEVLNVEKEMASITIPLSRDFLYTPGIIAKVTRVLTWKNINIYENISTMTELIFIVEKKDALRAYEALQSLAE